MTVLELKHSSGKEPLEPVQVPKSVVASTSSVSIQEKGVGVGGAVVLQILSISQKPDAHSALQSQNTPLLQLWLTVQVRSGLLEQVGSAAQLPVSHHVKNPSLQNSSVDRHPPEPQTEPQSEM